MAERRIVLVDDDPGSAVEIRGDLQNSGLTLAICNDLQAALRLLRRERIDGFIVALSDDAEGLAACEALRGEPGHYMAPLMRVTASDDRDVWQAAFAAGCDDVMCRPLEPVVLQARLYNLMEKAEYARELERVRANLARYVSPRLRQLLQRAQRGEGLPAPMEQEACILFSDIRGFTALARTIPSDVLFTTVSRHLGLQVEAVYAHGGYVDKFGGDGIMAVFDGADMVGNACACALDIMRANQELQATGGDMAVPMGIGIHVGPVVAGNIGTGEHLDYTVIGNTVNLAARLCGYARPMDVVVSDAVRERLEQHPEISCVDRREADIRGLRRAITLYRLAGREPERVR